MPALSAVLAVLQVSSHTSLVGAQARKEYGRIVDALGQKLRAARYNGSYFDRGAEAAGRLCTPEGWFSCQVSGVPFAREPPERVLSLPWGPGQLPFTVREGWPTGLGP